MAKSWTILGAEFRKIRDGRFVTQCQFATELGMSVSTVQRIEGREIVAVSLKTVCRLAALLNIAPQDLMVRIGTK